MLSVTYGANIEFVKYNAQLCISNMKFERSENNILISKNARMAQVREKDPVFLILSKLIPIPFSCSLVYYATSGCSINVY